jgi:wyosine [tRNA(Phe)-imidazoG37] synthetase (radical SAM superfamily)
VADTFLGVVGASSLIERNAREFLDHLMDMNSARVQSDVVDRVQESRRQLEVEIRKLLHEVRRIAERAVEHARTARAEGAPAVEAALARLDRIETEIRILRAPVERQEINARSAQ